MTTLAVELSVDSRGPCALYIASDSRVTWGDERSRWDSAQKTFISGASPDIFGFCGDAFVPTQVINQVVRQVEGAILFDGSMSARERHGRMLSTIKRSISNSHYAPFFDFTILHGAREGIGMSCAFKLWTTTFAVNGRQWVDREIPIKVSNSYFVALDGSGSDHLKNLTGSIDISESAGTSRGAFQKFFAHLKSGSDKFSGGAPQIVGVFRGKGPQYFGSIWGGSRYYCGSKVVAGGNFNNVLWFNERFERADGEKKKLLKGAQKH